MRLAQFFDEAGQRGVAAVDDGAPALRLLGVQTVYDLAREAVAGQAPLAEIVRHRRGSAVVDLAAAEAAGRLLPPLDHPMASRCWVSGTGLTHLGSAEARNKMHAAPAGPGAPLTDSMKMFQWGLEGGKPAGGGPGVQPEWFFKGNGQTLLASGQPLPLPPFALDGGEEPEVVGLYLIAEDGTPCRVGWALGNEFTDHRMEQANYLYLAHAKLRASAVGPELLLGDLPDHVQGESRILRDGQVVWERSFVSGEANMSHHLASLEYHHFKYPMFRQPGDVHVHFLGTSTLSCQDGFTAMPGDVFEIESPTFGRPLRNRLKREDWSVPSVRVL